MCAYPSDDFHFLLPLCLFQLSKSSIISNPSVHETFQPWTRSSQCSELGHSLRTTMDGRLSIVSSILYETLTSRGITSLFPLYGVHHQTHAHEPSCKAWTHSAIKSNIFSPPHQPRGIHYTPFPLPTVNPTSIQAPRLSAPPLPLPSQARMRPAQLRG